MSKEHYKNNHSSPQKKTVLITGANGQLGMTFQKIEKEYPQLNFVFKDSIELDIADGKSIDKVFKDIKPDYCINCAAYTNVERAEEEPEKAILVNAQAVLDLATKCKEYQTILVHISTDYVFDGKKNTPYTKDDIPNPINVYGASKLHGEFNIKKVLEHFFIIRTSWLYSKEFGKNFYKTIVMLAKEKRVLSITDAQIGCPTDAVNLVGFILDLISNRNDDYGIHHFSDNVVMSWYDFAKLILKENKFQDVKLIKYNGYKFKAKRPNYSVLL